MRRKNLPKLRRRTEDGRPFVELPCDSVGPDGTRTRTYRRVYLGSPGDPGADVRARYEATLGEWERAGRQLPPSAPDVTVTEVVVQFWTHHEPRYRDGHLGTWRVLLRDVCAAYGHKAAAEFGPSQLEALQLAWAEGRPLGERKGRAKPRPLCRREINRRASMVKRVFRWAAGRQLVPVEVRASLECVEGLRRGALGAREGRRVRPVPEEHVEAVLPLLSRQVGALVRLQLLTGARPGELLGLRPADVDRSGDVWIFRPERHKTADHGLERTVVFGPQAQDALRPFLERPPMAPCFQPREADEEHRARRAASRKTPASCGNRPGSNRKKSPKKKPGDRYTTTSLALAVRRACKRAQVPEWSPGQLRHTAATRIRREFGLEAAQRMLGHTTSRTTEVYAEPADLATVLRLVAEHG